MKLQRQLVIILAGSMLVSIGVAQSTPPSANKSAGAKAKLDDLVFLSGHNRGEKDGGMREGSRRHSEP